MLQMGIVGAMIEYDMVMSTRKGIIVFRWGADGNDRDGLSRMHV